MRQVKTYVPPSGNPNSKICIVGEQPGRQEVRQGRPFIGPAGENLDQCLSAAGISRSECYFTNVIKDLDFPLEQYITITEGKSRRGLLTSRGEQYVGILREELASLDCNIIVACGNVPLWALCSRVGITNWRGSILESTLLSGRKVIPTIHPATWTIEKLYANPEAYLNKYLVLNDLKKVRRESDFPEIRLLDREIKILPSFFDASVYLKRCLDYALAGGTIDYDIEITPWSQEMSCISLAMGPQECMSIAFIDSKGDIFTLQEETSILSQIQELLENPICRKRGQNIIFDSHFLFRKYGMKCRNLDDTMVAQKILYPEFAGNYHKGASLQFITSMWTDIPYYKQDGKLWLGGEGTWQEGWIYNAKDSLACADAFPRQFRELKSKGNIAAYERQVKLIEPLTYMMEHGIRIDREGMENKKSQNEEKIKELTREINFLMKKEINLNSPKQLAEYFYIERKQSPITKDGKITTNEEALKKLSSRGVVEASLILDLRGLTKENSTFIDTSNIDSDGRMRCSYNPVGTKFSRISSSKNIFGTGMNLQNVPHEVLSYFIADPGYVIYELDYSQYENRIVAYVGNILPMIEVFETGLDSHKMTAAMVLTAMGQHTLYDEVTSSERQDFGKRPNHAFNYGFGPNKFAAMHELSLATGKKIHSAYHAAYPGIRGGYWNYVEQCLREDRTLTNLMNRKVTFLGKWGEKFLHEAYSCIPQGTCGDCINEYGLNYVYYDSGFEKVELLTQTHDSLAIQIPMELGLEEHARILIDIKRKMETPLQFKEREFVTPVDLVVNKCLNKEVGVELKGKNFSENIHILVKMLDAAWLNLELEGWF